MKRIWLLVACLTVSGAALAPGAPVEEVEILRDPWGIPHVFADTDPGAFYGLGYATAEDRAYQMTYSLRIVQGRLSEVVGEVRRGRRDETSIDHDKKMRTFGFYRAARRVADHLDPESRILLQAYCDGVNAYVEQHQEGLHPLFEKTGLEPEPWTPADCLASWWHMGIFFATDGTRDLIAGRNAGRRPEPPAGLEPLPPDEKAAVIRRADLGEAWIEKVMAYAREHGLAPAKADGEGPKFSHAWVVGGRRTTTGAAVLVSDPQTPVRNPSFLYEFHVRGKTFDARGVGVPGSPILLIGFTRHVAWGVTALGADQADLFRLDSDREHPDAYQFDGTWRPMQVYRETIRVKGQDPVPYTVRETHLGPVATAFCFARPRDGEVALKRIPTSETDRDTIQGALAMMRARDATAFDKALEGWRFPSANIVFGDHKGGIGFRTLGAFPIRSRLDDSSGRKARPGHRSEQDWRGFAPHDLVPHVLNPSSGVLFSGNHRPIEAWYPIPLGTMTGSGGDTVRSWRLRERLAGEDRFTPEDVRAVHFDAVNPARRDIVRLGLHLRDRLKRELSPDAVKALSVLEPWYAGGASSSLAKPGAALAVELNTFFRFVRTHLAVIYGGGESGLAYFLKTATARVDADPEAELSPLEQKFIDQALADAWRSAGNKYGPDPEHWLVRARETVSRRRLGYYESLDGFPALDAAQAVAMPPLAVTDGGTLSCQTAQSYTQYVPMHDPDQAESILPIGQSERPEHPSRKSTLALWGKGGLHPAPLSREKVEAMGGTRTVVRIPAR